MTTSEEEIFDGFEGTMSGLEKGLQVIHITTPTAKLLCCRYKDKVEAVLGRQDLKPYDQIPVKQGKTIIGLFNKYIHEGIVTTDLIEDRMTRLGEDILVSADMPLLDFIKDKNKSLDRLVIRGTQIYGLVTKSDLLKLPVYLLGFALFMHIESQMLDMIRSTEIDQDTWINWVPSKNRENLEKRYNKLRNNKSDPDMLELTYFLDKVCILQELSKPRYASKYTSFLPEQSLIELLPELKELRNTVAHGDNHSDDNDTLDTFLDRLRHANEWIEGIDKWKQKKAK